MTMTMSAEQTKFAIETFQRHIDHCDEMLKLFEGAHFDSKDEVVKQLHSERDTFVRIQKTFR